jgi:hypothetical protein
MGIFFLLVGVGRTKPLLGEGNLLGRGALLRVRLRGALRRLFQEPEKILEIGIRQPPKELAQSRAELRRFFLGSQIVELEIPDPPQREEATTGRFSRVLVALEGLTLLGMDIEAARFTLEGLEVDQELLLEQGELQVRRLRSIHMAFRVTDTALNEMTEDFHVEVSPGRFLVRGRRKILVLPIGFRAAGRLRFTPKGEIYFHDHSMSLGGLPLPGLFRRALRHRINPLFDLQGYLGVAEEVFRVDFLEIRHQRGALVLEACAEVELNESS